jgi:NTE family protein
LCIVGCSSAQEYPHAEVSPRSLDEIQRARELVTVTRSSRPTVALVLGGGGLRGFAHLGVIRALEEAGVQPDVVVGTSAGAVVGAAYASGLSAEQIEAVARSVKLSSLIDLTLSTNGFMHGNNIARWIDTLTGRVMIEQFPRRFAAVATDLRSGRPVIFDSGRPGIAVQASAAVPGSNVPLAYKEGYLVDGGVSSLVPVRVARAMGADVVIAVDVFCEGPSSDGLTVPSVLLQVGRLQSCQVATLEKAEADVVISPVVRVSGMTAKREQEQAREAGYLAAKSALDTVRKRTSAGIDWVAFRHVD